MLPGQMNSSGGVSNLLFGTNIANYSFNRFDAAAQSQLRSIGITVLRIPLADNSNNPLSDSMLTSLVTGTHAAGAVLLAILPHQSQAYAQHAVQFLGNNCLLYELSNEPDLGHFSPATYTAMWNAWIPGLRAINPRAAFIGPVLGVVANFQAWMVPFLKGAQAAGTLPDAVSFHDYPCTGHPSQAVCSTKPPNIGKDATNLKALITATIGKPLPIAITEWNVDASSPLIAYAKNQSFVTAWDIAALDGMASAGVVLATQFETESSAYGGWLGAQPLASQIKKYVQGGAAPQNQPFGATLPVGNIPIIGPALQAAFTNIFGGAGFVPTLPAAITLAPNADVTELLQAMDEFMLIQNPFTESMGAIPSDTIGIPGVSTFTFTDPFSWLEQFGTNLFFDMNAAFVRSLFIIIGVLVLLKVIGEFIDFQALSEKIGQTAQSAIGLAALV